MTAYRKMAKDAKILTPAEREARANELAAAVQSETDVLIRGQMYRTLGAFDTISSSTALFNGLQDSDPEIRIACCDAWGQRGGPDAANALGDVLRNDSEHDVRMAAIRALGQIKDQSAVVALAPALEEPNPAMQWRAVRSLESVTGKYYGEDVNAWRSYVQGGNPRELSIAHRIGRMFY